MRIPEPVHLIAEEFRRRDHIDPCHKCGRDWRHWHVMNYRNVVRQGDVVCNCGAWIRNYAPPVVEYKQTSVESVGVLPVD